MDKWSENTKKINIKLSINSDMAYKSLVIIFWQLWRSTAFQQSISTVQTSNHTYNRARSWEVEDMVL